MGEGAQDEGGEKELVGQETVFHTWKSDALGFSSQIPTGDLLCLQATHFGGDSAV